MKLALVTFFGLILLASCEEKDPPPVADANFSVTGFENPAPATIMFFNTSSNATSYTWNFGDNTSSTEIQPTHIYTLPGSYPVKLKVSGPNGTDSICKIVNIEQPIVANKSAFSYFLDKCTGYPVGAAFKAMNPASSSHVWDFNGVPNLSKDPIIQFILPGDYTIKYSSLINGVRDTATRVIRIQ